MPPKKKLKNKTICSLCGTATSHFKRHARQSHLPWYLNPVSSCADCLKSEGDRYTTDRFHLGRGHGGIVGELLLQAWFLLMNGVFYFIMQELGLGSLSDLLGCAGDFGGCLLISDFLRKK